MSQFNPESFTKEAKQTWNNAAPRYDKLASSLFGPMAEEFIKFSTIKKGWEVLDVACGPGIASRTAAKKVGEKGRIVATDLAPEMIVQAKKYPAHRLAAKIEWHEMDAQKLTFPNEHFDAVICQLGLMLFAEPDKALLEMFRVAKPLAPISCLVQGRRSQMLYTAYVMDAIITRAPHLKALPGTPTLYSFGPDGIIEEAFMKAGLTEIVTKRLTGHFRFSSAEEYWITMTEGARKTRAMLDSLSPQLQEKVKADVIRRADRKRDGRYVLIPYEFKMARGIKPSKH